MNERINELLKQSRTEYWTQYTPSYDYEKFAELIVRDCLYIIYERKDQAIDMDWNVDEAMSCAAMHIAENFGLQE
jgi:hypothetical protein